MLLLLGCVLGGDFGALDQGVDLHVVGNDDIVALEDIHQQDDAVGQLVGCQTLLLVVAVGSGAGDGIGHEVGEDDGGEDVLLVHGYEPFGSGFTAIIPHVIYAKKNNTR